MSLRATRSPAPRPSYYGIEPLPANQQRAARSSELVFAYVGRLVREKGLPLLLGAAKKLLDQGYSFRVKLVGDGPERARLEALADQLGLERVFSVTGFLRGEELLNAVEDVDALVMPSIWEETAGMAAIEQMMRGRLVLAANIGGLGEVVGSGGILFEAGDEASLVAAMRRVLDDRALIAEYGSRASARARSLFTLDRMIRDHLDLYRSILNKNGMAQPV